MGSNLTSEHDHSRPADILLPNWALGKPAAFDISVTSPLNPKIVSVAGLSAGAACLVHWRAKAYWERPQMQCFGLVLCTSGHRVLWCLGKGSHGLVFKRCLPPVLPSYRANQSQLCCLNCIAGSTCIWWGQMRLQSFPGGSHLKLYWTVHVAIIHNICIVWIISRVCNRLSGYSGYSDIRKNLSVRIAI